MESDALAAESPDAADPFETGGTDESFTELEALAEAPDDASFAPSCGDSNVRDNHDANTSASGCWAVTETNWLSRTTMEIDTFNASPTFKPGETNAWKPGTPWLEKNASN